MSSVFPKDVLHLIIREYVCDVLSPDFDLRTAVRCLAVSRFVRSCVPQQVKVLTFLPRRQIWDLKCHILRAVATRDLTLRQWVRTKLPVDSVPIPEQFQHYLDDFGACTICGKVLPVTTLSKHQRKCLTAPIMRRYDRCDKCYATHPHLKGKFVHTMYGCPMVWKRCCRYPRCDYQGPVPVVNWHHDNGCVLKLYTCAGMTKNGQPCKRKFRKTSTEWLCPIHRRVANAAVRREQTEKE